MVFKYVYCNSWVIQLVPEWHLRGGAGKTCSSQLLHPHQELTVLCLPGPRPAPCLQQMWFTGQGSLLKQLSVNGRSFQCCWVPGTLCDGNGGHPLWSSSLAHLQGHPRKCETGIYLFCPSSTLLDTSAFFLAFFPKPWSWHGTKSDLPWLGCQGWEPFLLNAHLGWHNRECLLVPSRITL